MKRVNIAKALLFWLTIIPTVLFAQTYPNSTGTNTGWEYISNVSINSINNTSTGSDADGDGDDGYDDYSNISSDLIVGQTYTLSVTISVDANDYVKAWIDWNNNNDFTDAGESYTLATNTSSNGPFTANITVPAAATQVPTRMRVSLKWNGVPTSSETFSYGEVEDYTLNISIDTDGDGISNYSDLDDDNDGILDEDENICFSGKFQNGSFENYQIPANTYKILDASNILGWNTTASDNKVEIWGNNFQGIPAYHGTMYAEINANMAARMYQTISVSSGDLLRWTVAHHGRQGTDEMYIKVGPVGTPTLVADVFTDNTAWVTYTNTYTVPSGVTTVELGFEAGTTAGPGPSYGNLIDNVNLYILSSTACDFDGDGVPNYLDLDSDNDGISDVIEAGGSDPDGDGRIGTGAITDTDSDGLSNLVDADNGGTPLTLADTDGDGTDNYMDQDSDGDAIPDNVEAQATVGYVAPSGSDTDGDGLDNAYDADNGGVYINPQNTDNTGNADYISIDSDGDGVSDYLESGITISNLDADGDGLDDAVDVTTGCADPNGICNVPATDLPDSDSDVNTGGDVDYRDATNDNGGLPVDYVDFYSEIAMDGIDLFWSTASEINSNYFILERSDRGILFDDIAQISAAGNSNQLLKYHFKDVFPYEGYNYYRLKQVDMDGSFQYSKFVVEYWDNQYHERFSIMPNPAKNMIHINANCEGDFELLDLNGKVIMRQHLLANTPFAADISAFASGLYISKLKTKSNILQQKVVVK